MGSVKRLARPGNPEVVSDPLARIFRPWVEFLSTARIHEVPAAFGVISRSEYHHKSS